MNEAETRADHIDPALRSAGWGVIDGSRILREHPITPGRIEGLGRRGKALTADYVLVHRNHKLAVVEAKAWDEELTLGVAQAKNYAGKMGIRCTYAEGKDRILLTLAIGAEQMAEMQKVIDAEKSDLFDVLAHVAYALPPLTREERASKAKVEVSTRFNTKQQVFLDFVLSHYVSEGVRELDQEKLTPLLRLKYRDSIADAVADLGRPDEIGKVFAGFQKYLYQEESAA